MVKKIKIFTTRLNSPDNKEIIIPNGPLSNGIIENFTSLGVIRVDLVIGIDYGADIKQARKVLLETMESDEKVLKSPAPSVNVLELGDSSINLAVRPFCKPEHYWDVYFKTYEECKETLDKHGIEIPYPHQVHVQK